jgi:hypothetical protein
MSADQDVRVVIRASSMVVFCPNGDDDDLAIEVVAACWTKNFGHVVINLFKFGGA